MKPTDRPEKRLPDWIDQAVRDVVNSTIPAVSPPKELHYHLSLVAKLLAEAPNQLPVPVLLFQARRRKVGYYELTAPFTFGRAPDCVMCCARHREISRLHFTVEPEAGGHILRDHSSNGTLVQGRRVRACELRNGDVVTAGEFLFVYING